jgi:hypothetical protein
MVIPTPRAPVPLHSPRESPVISPHSPKQWGRRAASSPPANHNCISSCKQVQLCRHESTASCTSEPNLPLDSTFPPTWLLGRWIRSISQNFRLPCRGGDCRLCCFEPHRVASRGHPASTPTNQKAMICRC